MTKVALLVGVSEYQSGFNPLPKASRDVEEMQRVLQNSEIEGFDEIKPLIDPDPQTLRVEIETLFSRRSKDDLILLFFSGHGIKDDLGNLYLATRDTRKTTTGELVRATAVDAGFVQSLMSNSRCKRQVVLLDCCFSGAFAAGMAAKDDGTVDVAAQLGGEGRAVLTSSTSTQYSFEEDTSDLSIYTRYIVEGLETGAADIDRDGWIEVEELHAYAKGKVQEAAPAMKPEIYAVKEGYKIRLTRARVGDPKLHYRQEAERYASRGEIGRVGRIILDTLRDRLELSTEDAARIEAELLEPYRERLKHLQQYREAVQAAVETGYPFKEQTRNDLNHFKDILGLRAEDVAPIEAEVEASATPSVHTHVRDKAEPPTSRPTPARAMEETPTRSTASPQVSPQYRVEKLDRQELTTPAKSPEPTPQSPKKSNITLQWIKANATGGAVIGITLVVLPSPVDAIVAGTVGWLVVGLMQGQVLKQHTPHLKSYYFWVCVLSLPAGLMLYVVSRLFS